LKTTVFVGASLDGYIARPDHGLDFLGGDAPPPDSGFDAFFASVDALLVGRNTYDVVLGLPFWPYGAKPVFVRTRRPLGQAPEGAVVEPISGEPAELLTALAARGCEHVYVDGGVTIQEFLRAGLIDRLVITWLPVLIGSGIPLFGDLAADVRLELASARTLEGGALQAEYRLPGA